MDFELKLRAFPKYARISILAFLVTLSFGYFTGLMYVEKTTQFSSDGIDENYNGNENLDSNFEDYNYDSEINEDSLTDTIKYKKSEQEIITIIHTHVISFSLIFLALGALLCLTSFPVKLKKVLIIEPFISIILTFGGIWLLWKEITWMKYIVMISGILLTITFIISALLIVFELLKKNRFS